MKYIVIIGDGMADFPLDELGGKTPLMTAHKPYMDMMAREGACGKVLTIPEGFSPGSDVACMSIFGYSPAKYYTGRAPIEASGMGIKMGEADVAFRCNLVYLTNLSGSTIMTDYSSGHITTDEARVLIDALQRETGSGEFTFFPGISYRHIMLWNKGLFEMETTPPHDITGKDILSYLPKGKGADKIIALMKNSQEIFREHRINKTREETGKVPANSIWLWGQGKRSQFPLFFEKYGVRGATVAAVDLIKGISSLIGFDTPHVEGATGYLDTDYSAKAARALELLKDHDIVYIHIEAPDEASHNGNVNEKIKAIEHIDSEVVGSIYEKIGEQVRMLIVTDHATPITMKTHHACPVPYVIFEKGRKGNGCPTGYDERSGDLILDGEALIEQLIKGKQA
ncbi:MAG: cofactor-independent phosphoglycerate mutase [Proteobacteria bacterium]|nr:cofactor-independent phosphoglycerate mutase [Pseudomonadota bacterium]